MKRMKPSFWASGIREQTPPLGRAAAEAVTWRPTWNFSWVEKLVYSEKLNKAVFTPDRWWVPKDPGEGFGGWRGERRLGRLGISSVQFSRSVMSNCLRPHGLQHTRLPCTLPTAGAYSDSCLLSWWCHPTISSSVIPLLLPPSICPSIRVFSDDSFLCIRWPNYWSFSFSISPSSEYSGLISFRTDWLDFRVVQGTLKSLLQHHSSKASILQCSAFFIVQLSHPYMTMGKTIALTRWNFCQQINVSAF